MNASDSPVLAGLTAVDGLRTSGCLNKDAATATFAESVKDVARVLRIPPGEADRITKLIPSGPAYSLSIADAERKVDELRDLVKGNPAYRRLPIIARFRDLDRAMLVRIMTEPRDALYQQFRDIFANEGVALEVAPAVFEQIAELEGWSNVTVRRLSDDHPRRG